jgi:hypothetical protein
VGLAHPRRGAAAHVLPGAALVIAALAIEFVATRRD